MSGQRILRIRRTDVNSDDAAFVLVSVTSNGPQPLDLKLIGTDGEEPFVGSIKHKHVKKLQAHNYRGDDQEWEAMLSHVLLKPRRNYEAKSNFEGLEVVASLGEDHQLSITLRKSIGGITPRLGSILLKHEPDEEIELFQWTSVAVQAATATEDETNHLQAKYDAQQTTIDQLNAQLHNLIQTKQDHENALLAKFQELLNSKKLKIRDQQRLLAGAKVDPVAAAAVESARASKNGRQSRKAGPSRASKRKANSKAPVVSESDEDEETRMQLDEEGETEEEMTGRMTPEKSDLDETEDDDDDDEGFDAVATSRPTKTGIGSKGKAVKTVTQREKSPEQQSIDKPPPRRELPFARRTNAPVASKKQPEQPAPAPQDDEDVTTDDDEL